MVIKKKVSFIDTKPKQMMNINVKVNIKVKNGTFSKRRKNSNLKKLMYEGQGQKLSDFKMKKKGIFH